MQAIKLIMTDLRTMPALLSVVGLLGLEEVEEIEGSALHDTSKPQDELLCLLSARLKETNEYMHSMLEARH
jgi:hypothetical protein